jgi:hypothetical protein
MSEGKLSKIVRIIALVYSALCTCAFVVILGWTLLCLIFGSISALGMNTAFLALSILWSGVPLLVYLVFKKRKLQFANTIYGIVLAVVALLPGIWQFVYFVVVDGIGNTRVLLYDLVIFSPVIISLLLFVIVLVTGAKKRTSWQREGERRI